MLNLPTKFLITAPLGSAALSALEEFGNIKYDPWVSQIPFRVYGPEDLAETLTQTQAEVLICEADFCFGPVFETGLKIIAATRGDPTNVDLEAATQAGIPVICTPGRNADAVAEHVLALLLAVSRNLLKADFEVRNGEIFSETLPYQRHRAKELAGQTLGIVGLGAVGRALKWRAVGLGMKVIAFDPNITEESLDSLETLLQEADIVSMHAPAAEETRDMIGEREFGLMKPGAIFINTARASLHNLEALTAALESGQIAGAGLDHFDGEMLPEGHPLLKRSDVVLTPHIGGATYDTEERHGEMIVSDLQRLFQNQSPVNIANPKSLNI